MQQIITSDNILLIISILLISSVLIGKMSYRFGLPLLLVFLLVGMGFGVDGHDLADKIVRQRLSHR